MTTSASAPVAADTAAEEETSSLPSRAVLDEIMIENLLQPPDRAFARALARDIGGRLKRHVPPVILADALRRLAKSQRSSRARDHTFVRSALIDRLRREPDWIRQPLVGPLPAQQETAGDGEGLPNGTWSWKAHSVSTESTDEGRYVVLHLLLTNTLADLDIGQPYDIVLADGSNTYGWSAVASAEPPGTCPDGCQGTLSSVGVPAETEVLGHLCYPISADVTPTHWGLLDEDSITLRALPK